MPRDSYGNLNDKTETNGLSRIIRLETLAEVTGKQLDRVEAKVDGLTVNFRDYKDQVLTVQLSNLEKEHSQKMKTLASQTETTARVKILWTAIGVLITAMVAGIIRAWLG